MKEKYQVVRIDTQHYFGKTEETKTVVGETFAPSAAKAINNIKYRLGIKPGDLNCDYMGDGGRITRFEAIRI